MNIKLPKNVLKIINILENAGFEAWVVGGCVRDSLLNQPPKDWDLTTNALPQDVISIFEKNYNVIPTGIAYGTVTIVIEGEEYEITTYRKEKKYIDGRHPEVSYSNSIQEDLKRRDFTINALAYNPTKGIMDLFNGIKHLQERKIVAVGDAKERFKEDGLRILRAIRFACKIDGSIEKNTLKALKSSKEYLRNVSNERKREELCKILMSKTLVYQDVLAELLKDIMPEWSKCFNTIQNNPYHIYTVAEHTLKAVQYIENDIILKLSAFFHDIGKPSVKFTDAEGIDHFYRHNVQSANITERIMKDLRFDNKTIDKVTRLVYWHDRPIDVTEKAVRKAINQIGEDIFSDLLKLKIADIKAQNPVYLARINLVYKIQKIYEKITKENQCFKLKDLAVNGKDLINAGYKQGKIIGEILNYLLEAVIENPQVNNKDKLIQIAKEKFAIN